MADVDVFAGNLTMIDWELHDLWIRGLSVTEAVAVMRERGALTEYPGENIQRFQLTSSFPSLNILTFYLLVVNRNVKWASVVRISLSIGVPKTSTMTCTRLGQSLAGI